MARGKKIQKNLKIIFLNLDIFFAYDTPRPPMSVYKKIQPNESSRLAGYTQHT